MRFMILLALVVTSCSALSSASPASKFQLSYFNAKGAAEVIRLLFALGGGDEQDYDDIRFDITPGTMDSPAFKAGKESGAFTMNLDRVPILVTPTGETIGQSKAIERFLARRFGLMGSTEVEAAQIDCVVEHCRDVKDAQMRKRFSMFVKDRTEEEKAAAQKEWFDTDLPLMLSKVERALKEMSRKPGCAVGDSISLADLAIFSLLKDGFPLYQEQTYQAAKECPSLLQIVDAVSCHPKINKWLQERPLSSF